MHRPDTLFWLCVLPKDSRMKCQNPKGEREREKEGDHNMPIINRKWLHYGLKDGRE